MFKSKHLEKFKVVFDDVEVHQALLWWFEADPQVRRVCERIAIIQLPQINAGAPQKDPNALVVHLLCVEAQFGQTVASNQSAICQIDFSQTPTVAQDERQKVIFQIEAIYRQASELL